MSSRVLSFLHVEWFAMEPGVVISRMLSSCLLERLLWRVELCDTPAARLLVVQHACRWLKVPRCESCPERRTA